jgi:hypothetical protein
VTMVLAFRNHSAIDQSSQCPALQRAIGCAVGGGGVLANGLGHDTSHESTDPVIHPGDRTLNP